MPFSRVSRCAQEPLNPIHRAQGGRIGFPPITLIRWILIDPTLEILLVPKLALLGPNSIQIIEIMKVIEPQFFPLRMIPIAGFLDGTGDIQKGELKRLQHKRTRSTHFREVDLVIPPSKFRSGKASQSLPRILIEQAPIDLSQH